MGLFSSLWHQGALEAPSKETAQCPKGEEHSGGAEGETQIYLLAVLSHFVGSLSSLGKSTCPAVTVPLPQSFITLRGMIPIYKFPCLRALLYWQRECSLDSISLRGEGSITLLFPYPWEFPMCCSFRGTEPQYCEQTLKWYNDET